MTTKELFEKRKGLGAKKADKEIKTQIDNRRKKIKSK